MERLKIVRLAIGASAIFLGIFGLFLSVPILAGDLLLKPGNGTLYRIQERKTVTPEGIGRLIDSRQRALEWWNSEHVWADLGLAHLVHSAWVDKPQARSELAAAHEALKQSLNLAPANPYVWTRLAYVNYLLQGVSGEMVNALRMALITGPNEQFIAHVRLELGLLAWGSLTGGDRKLIERQAVRAWTFNPDRALEITR
ncbi:MAG: hypothetical protein ACPHIA_06945, partial [Alphaproteobacteria bacterium]